MKYPYKGKFRVTSPYGTRTDPISGQAGTWHGGIDLVGEDKTIISPRSGTVLRSRIVLDSSDRTSEWGNYIALQTDGGEVLYFCHLASRLVNQGDVVTCGQPIGIEGSSGRSTASHLHFEVRIGGVQTDPAEYLGIPNTAGFIGTSAEDEEQPTLPHKWSEDAIKWAVENRILLGNESGDLKLDEPCTREETAVLLYRLYGMITKQ